MTPSSPQNLLRRTSLAIAALAAAWIAMPAAAVTVKLGGSSAGETCSYTGTTVDPSGNVTIMCSAQATGGLIGSGSSPPPPPTGPDTLTLTSPVSTIATGGTFNAVLTRTGAPSSGTVKVNLAVIGACTSTSTPVGGGGSLTLASTDAGPFNIPIVAAATAGTCTILYNIGFGGAVTSGSTQLNIPVGATTTPSSGGGGGTTPPPSGGTGGAIPTVAGCPTPANGTAVLGVLGGFGNHMSNDGTTNGFWLQPSGIITAVALPTLGSATNTAGNAAGILTETYGGVSPAAGSNYEIQISKCPGVIDPTVPVGGAGLGTQDMGAIGLKVPGYCYFASTNPNNVALPWYALPSTSPPRSLAQLALGGNCTADQSQGTWYANIRYTYSVCEVGTNKCGMQIQWNPNGP